MSASADGSVIRCTASTTCQAPRCCRMEMATVRYSRASSWARSAAGGLVDHGRLHPQRRAGADGPGADPDPGNAAHHRGGLAAGQPTDLLDGSQRADGGVLAVQPRDQQHLGLGSRTRGPTRPAVPPRWPLGPPCRRCPAGPPCSAARRCRPAAAPAARGFRASRSLPASRLLNYTASKRMGPPFVPSWFRGQRTPMFTLINPEITNKVRRPGGGSPTGRGEPQAANAALAGAVGGELGAEPPAT